MGTSAVSDSYWFDAAPLLSPRKRKGPLQVLGSALPGRQLSGDEHDALAAFTAANDLGYVSWAEPRDRADPLPGIVLTDTCVTIATGTGPYFLEIGNHGWRFWKAESDGSASRRGYIAIRHDLDLPHLYLDSSALGAATALAVATVAVNVAGAFDLESASDGSAVDGFRSHAMALEVPPGTGFTPYVDTGDAGAKKSRLTRRNGARADAAAAATERIATTTALISGAAAPHLTELAQSFDVEVCDGWIFAYCNYGELSTLDPEIWAWAFGATSRLFDVLDAWGVDTTDAREQRWYTSEHIPRPQKVDGALRALVPKQDSKLGRFLFGSRP